MARGAPDDSNVVTTQAVFRLDDMAELAARLGSIVRYHRFGNVIFTDDFSCGKESWTDALCEGGGTVNLSNDAPLSAGICLALDPGPVGGGIADIRRGFALPVPGKFGLELAFYSVLSPLTTIFYIIHYTGEKYYRYSIRYNWLTGVLYYLDGVSDWTELETDLWLSYGTRTFHIAKLILNTDTNLYERFYLDENSYLLEGLEPLSSGSIIYPQLQAGIQAGSWGAANHIVYVDNIIISQNEL